MHTKSLINSDHCWSKVAADSNGNETSGWRLHEPDPADYFPPHLRRELLLADSSRTLLSTRNLTASYENATFFSMRNGTLFQTHAVKELFGLEKTFELQDPALRVLKRSV